MLIDLTFITAITIGGRETVTADCNPGQGAMGLRLLGICCRVLVFSSRPRVGKEPVGRFQTNVVKWSDRSVTGACCNLSGAEDITIKTLTF